MWSTLYIAACLYLGYHDYSRGWTFLSTFLVSLFLTPIVGVLFSAMRGVNHFNARGQAHLGEKNTFPPEKNYPREDDPWDENDDIVERRRRDFYRDKGQIKDNY